MDMFWIDVHVKEGWLSDGIKKTTSTCHRTKVENVVKQLRADIKDRINLARGSSSSSLSDDDDDHYEGKHLMRKKPILVIRTDAHELTAMNYTKKTVVQADKAACLFFAQRIRSACGLAKNSAVHRRYCTRSPTDTGTDVSGTDSSNPAPTAHGAKRAGSTNGNIRGKLWWSPSTFGWIVNSLKPLKGVTMPFAEEFQVDNKLTGLDFLSERSRTYEAAAATWNKTDGSKRPRLHDKYGVEFGK